ELVKDLEKLGQARVWVGQHAVPMVGHEAHGVESDAGAFGGECQAVLDVVIGEPRRTEQELTLRASASDEVGPSRENLSGQGHRSRSVDAPHRLRIMDRALGHPPARSWK